MTGVPDMVLEIVTRSSRDKDLTQLMELYFEAGIAEYWVVDSTITEPKLIILEKGRNRYRAVKEDDGWVRSSQLQTDFRLIVSAEQRKRLSHVTLEQR